MGDFPYYTKGRTETNATQLAWMMEQAEDLENQLQRIVLDIDRLKMRMISDGSMMDMVKVTGLANKLKLRNIQFVQELDKIAAEG